MYAAKIISFLKQKNYLLYFFILAIFFVIYILIVGQIKSYTKLKENNFNSFLESNEFVNIKEYIFENLNSPYKEFNYIVQNNDTIEKIIYFRYIHYETFVYKNKQVFSTQSRQ